MRLRDGAWIYHAKRNRQTGTEVVALYSPYADPDNDLRHARHRVLSRNAQARTSLRTGSGRVVRAVHGRYGREDMIRLSQTAPWNSALRNGYRERFAQVGERKFMISASSLNSGWTVEEVDDKGGTLWDSPSGECYLSKHPLVMAEPMFMKWVGRLSDARRAIAVATAI